MITKHSIDLKKTEEPCFAVGFDGTCKVCSAPNNNCGSWLCPFYKPKDCKAWVRIDDSTGVNLIPPEDAFIQEAKK